MARSMIWIPLAVCLVVPCRAAESLWAHLGPGAEFADVRAVAVDFDPVAEGGRLTVTADGGSPYAWATVPRPRAGWMLERRAAVEAAVTNRGRTPVEVMLWVVGAAGWESVCDMGTLDPGVARTFSCPLRRTFPDGTPHLDPGRVDGVRVMLKHPQPHARIEVTNLVAAGEAAPWTRPHGRLEVPAVEDAGPAPGRRVRLRIAAGADENRADACLYLPTDWRDDRRYPIVVEYPGNVFYTRGCYSTGRPEQCVIGYGMTCGRGSIWISLPFVGADGAVAEHGWGDADVTADLCVRAVEEVCANFGGDRARLVLTGFSRGAIACGFIGLRNERIAGLWRALHCCQHYDGDGWNGATLEGALERARRFSGSAVFHTDNPAERVEPLTAALRAPTTFASSGLGAHSCAMFLDDRESTRRLREWYAALVASGTMEAAERP